MKMRVYIVAASLFALCLAAVAEGAQPAPKEPAGECYCSECGMAIRPAARNFLSEIILTNGKTLYFCDLGDMMTYYDIMKKKDDVAALYIKDHISGAWADGRTAYYLTGSKVATPMRFGILSFKDRAAAEKVKKEKGGGVIYDFKGIIASKAYRR